MARGNKEWWVEYDFIDTKWDRRPNFIKTFKTEAEAREFAKTQPDAVVQELIQIDDCVTEEEKETKSMTLAEMNDLCAEIDKKLMENHISAEVYPALYYRPNRPEFCVHIDWGDWKHEHLRAKWIIEEEFGYSRIGENITEENGTDCYCMTQRFLVA